MTDHSTKLKQLSIILIIEKQRRESFNIRTHSHTHSYTHAHTGDDLKDGMLSMTDVKNKHTVCIT